MPSQDNIKALYEELKNTYDVGSEDDFRNYLSDSNNREALRKELADDYEVGDSAAFSSYLGYDTPEKPQEKPAASSGTPMTEAERQAMMNSTRDMMMGANQRARQAVNKMQYATTNSGLQVKPINLGQNNKVVEKEPTYNPETGEVQPTYITESGNEYGSREGADLEQNAVDRQKYIEANQDKINREQVANLTEDIDAQIEEHKQNNRSALSYGVYYGGAAGRNETNNPEWNTLIAAQRSMRDAQRIINEADHNAQAGTLGKWLESSFVGGAARGFGQKLFDIDNWDMGLSDAHDAAAMRAALKAYDEGKELTRAQQSLLDAKAVELATQAYFGSYVGRGYKAGEVTAESIPFMIEMCLNPAAGTGKGIQNIMAKYALKRFGKKAIRDNAKKYLATKALTRATGDIVGGAAMAGSTGAAGVAADTMERMNGQVKYGLDNSGQAFFTGHEEGKDLGTAFREAYTARTIENYSEMMGEYFAPVLGRGASAIMNSKVGTKLGLDSVNDFIEKVSANDIAKLVTDFEKHAKWNGVIGEYAEEVAGGIANAILVGDQTLDANSDTGVFNLSNNIDTFLGVSLMGGVLSAAKTVGYRTPKYRARQEMKSAENEAVQAFGKGYEWAEIRNAIDLGEDVTDKLTEVMSSPEFTQAQKAAVLKYAGAAETYRGMLQGEAKRREEADPVQVDAETSFDNGYSLETPQELNDAKNNFDYQRQRAEDRFGEIKGLDDYPVQTIQTMQQQGYSPEDIQLALDYVNAKATYDGMQQRVADDVEGQVSIANSTIDRRTNRDTGMVHPITLNNDHKGYVVGGELVMSDNGIDISATKQANNDNMIFIADEEGKIQAISVDDIASADAPIDAAQEKAQAEQTIRQTYTQQAEDKMNGVLPFNNGDTYNVVDEEGQQHQVQVVETPAVEQQGALAPSQTDVIVSIDGGQPVQMPKQQVQDMYNAASLARFNQYEEEKQQEQAEALAQAETETETETPQAAAEETQQPVEEPMPMIGEGEDAEPDFSKATPERAYAYIYKEADLPQDKADQFVEANKKVADSELKKIQKKEPAMGTSIAAYKKAMNEWQQAVGAAQERADYWKQIQDMRKAESPAEISAEVLPEKVLTVKQNKPANVDSNTKAWREAKEKYGEYLNDDIDTPNDIMELVAMNMPSNINWEGRDGKRGLQAELGLKRGIGKKYDTNAFNSYLAKKGEGQSFDEAVHSIWESDNNLLPNGEHRFDDTDIRNALLDMFMNASKPSDITNYVLNNRVRMAEDALRAEQDRQEEYEEMQRMQQESMETVGMTIEEYDYLMQYGEELAPIREEYENSQEYLDNIEKNSNFAGDGRERKESTGGIPSEGAGEVETGISGSGQSTGKVQGQASDEIRVPEDGNGRNPETEGRTEAGTRIVREYVKNILDQAGVDVSLADRMSDDEVHELNGLIADWEKVNDRYGRVVEEQDKNLKSKDKAVRDAAQKKIDSAQEKANEAFEPVERYIRDLQLNELSDEELVKFVADKEANAENEDALYDDADYVAALDIMEERDLGERAGETSNTSSPEEIAAEEAKVNTQPTEGQKEAGNYKMGHIKVDGFDVTIENPKGSVRSGVDADGKEWSQTMNNTYGYIRGTEGVDGDHIDVFLSENPEQGSVFVVDQVNPKTGEFDEHKVMYGFASAEEAKQAYLANYEEGWQGLGVVTEVSKEEFKKWVESSHRKTKPFSEYKSVKPIGAQNEGTEPQDANLIPRDAEEEKIVADVNKQLQKDIDAAIKVRNKAASDLQKARAKESDRATDLFGNDNAFNQEGQLFDNSEMPVDQSVEGVSRRTQAEQEAFNEATANLAKLQSPQERNSRIRGALDNHRNQTSMQYAESGEQAVDNERSKEIKREVEGFKTETPEEAAAFDARIKDMTDPELLAYMAEDGKGDVNKAYHVNLYDEYDSRHADEEVAAHDSYSQILHDNGVTKEQAEEMLFNLRKDISLFTTADRPELLGQDSALEEYIQELEAQEEQEAPENTQQERPATDEIEKLKEERDSLIKQRSKLLGKGLKFGVFDKTEIIKEVTDVTNKIKAIDKKIESLQPNSKPVAKNTVADREAGGALVDQLTSMGVEVDTDAETYRKTKKSAKNDNSESGKMREMRTSDGKVYGFTYRGKMYLDPQKIDAELPLHEYGHLWCEAFRKLNPEGWKKIVDTIKKDADSWKFVTSLYPDLKDENDIAEEVIAEFSGKRGAEKLLEELQRMGEKDADYKSRWGNIFKNISKAIQDFWKAVGDFLHITYKNAEQIYDQVLKDFVNKVNPRRLVEKYLSDRNKAYMQAVEDGDIAKATEIFNEALSENIGNGITPYLAVAQYLKNRTLAHAVKSRDAEAVRKVAEKIAPLIPENAVLVPAPSHTGEATDMLDVANAIAEITGAEVADVLKSKPRGSQYDAKIAGTPLSADELGITMNGELPEGKIPVVIDNVVDTGNTAEACVKALGKGIVCALGDSADKYNHVASLKSAAPVIRDRNGKVIPLDKRFDLSGSNYLGREVLFREGDDLEAVNARFNEDLSGLTPENADNVTLSLGRPSNILLSAGVSNMPMKLYGNKVLSKMKKHGFALEELKNLPMAVANPIAVFNNLGREGNRSVLTELKTTQGNFLVTIDLGKDADVDFNIVSSVFGKRGTNIVDWFNKGFATYIDKEKALAFLSHQSAPIAAAAAKAELNSAAKVIENFENPKLFGENFANEDKILYREGEEPTLMGVHNISEDKLKKAIKQGGLANPSLAVIDTKKSTHTDYGDISLIPKSGLIDSKKGRNAGTYGGDAWTPTYPTVEKQMSDKGYKAFYADMDKVTDNRDLWSRLISRWDNHLEGRNDEGLAYWFQKERGEKPEDVMYESELNSEQMKRFAEVTDNGKKSFTDLDEAGRRAIIDLWAEKEGTTGDELLRKYKEVVRKVNDELLAKEETTSFRKMRIEQQNKEIDEYGIILSPVNDFMYGVKRDMERQGKMDVDTTLRKAFEKMQADGLMDEYTKWLEQKEERYGVKEVIFDGYTYDGRRKYVPNTLKNASRLMTKQGKENAYGQTGFGATRAMLLDKMRTLDDIRKQKDKIVADDERLKEVLQEASDEMYDVVHALSDMQKISDNPFSNNDYANARLQEALQERDPIGHLNREYGYDIDRNGEFAESLKQMVEHVKNLPVKYFETKFERPVTLDEFAIAVVPEGTSQDVVDALKDAGLDVRTYAKGSSLEETTENRRKATMDAVEGRDDVLFRMGDEEEQPIFYSNAMRVVEDIKQEKATPAQWLAMIQKNGGLKMGEDKWLGLSEWLKEREQASSEDLVDNSISIKDLAGKTIVGYRYGEAPESGRSYNSATNELEAGVSMASVGYLGEIKSFAVNYYRGKDKRFYVGRLAEDTGGDDEILLTDVKEISKEEYDRELHKYVQISNDLANALYNRTEGLASRGFGVDINVAKKKRDAALRPVGKSIITKQEVLDYIRSNQIQVEEVSYSENVDKEKTIQENIQETIGRGKSLEELQQEVNEHAESADRYDRLGENPDPFDLDEYLMQVMKDEYGDDFLMGYSIIGGEIYYHVDPYDLDEDAYNTNIAGDDNRAINSVRLDYTTQGLENKREIALVVPTIESWNESDQVHFGDAGEGRAVAWVRFGETKDGQGNNVLVIDEIQSKRHQEGRERGYKKPFPEEKKAAMDEALRKSREYNISMQEKYKLDTFPDQWHEKATQEEIEEGNRLFEDYLTLLREYESFNGLSGVPDAPFDKNWHELAMKRMLRYAAENGYDKVAWTTGEQQADRYDIGNVLSKINVYPQPDTKDRQVIIYLKNGDSIDLSVDKQGIVETSGYNNKPLSDVVGKPLAEKILSATKNEVIDGDGLRLGAEGMKGFYDEILPRFMNKYGKKWGVKVGEVTLPYLEQSAKHMWAIDVTPEMKESVMQGQPLFRLREDAAPKNTGIGYKLFVLKDGKLYPPMVANPNGAPTPVGIWLDADAAPIVGTTKTGRPQVKAGGKGTQGGSGQLAYRPGWHLGTIPYALQFNRKDASGEKTLFPANFVWAEVEYANDVDYQEEANKEGINANGKYQHSLAGLKRVPKDGSYTYRTNPNPETDPWVITGAMKVKRLLKPSEVDELVKAAGRKPQQRQDGYVSDAEIDVMNAKIDELEREGDVENDTYGTYEESLAASRAAGYTKKQHDAYQRRLRTRIRQAAEDVIAKLNLTGKVTLLENGESLQGRKARAKGFFNPDTGDIVIVLGNHRNVEDVVKTVLHECVAHYGLRQLFGKNFDNFLYNVLSSATPEIREQITEQARQLNWDFDTAIEEYLARLAEDTDFERAMDRGWWTKIKEAFLNMLDKLGLRGYFKGELSDNELRYILWRSYQNLSEPDRYRNPFNVAEDVAMQYKLNVGNYTHSEKPNGTVAPTEETAATKAAESKAKVVRMGHIEDFLPEIKNRKNEETIEDYVSKMSAAEAKAAYKRINAQMLDEDGLNLDEHFEKTKREWIDKHGLKGVGKQQADELQKAIDKYGAKMVELRWNLMDRLIELDEFDTSLFRDGDDFTEHVNSIPRRYGLFGGAPFQVISSKEDLEWVKSKVSPKAAEKLQEAYEHPKTTGVYIYPANIAVIFGEKCSSPEEAELTWWHEQTHGFFHSLPRDKQNRYGKFCFESLSNKYPKAFLEITQSYKVEEWYNEACAYFTEIVIKKFGGDTFMAENFDGNEDFINFANDLRDYLKYETDNQPERFRGRGDEVNPSRHSNLRGRNNQPQSTEQEEAPRASYRISGDGTQEAYNRAVNTGKKGTLRTTGYNFREAFQDSMLSVKKLQEVVEKKYGIKLPQSEDAYKHENALSSTNMEEQKRFIEGIAEDMLKAADKLLLKGSSKEELRDYLIAKHGLERNVVFAERDFEKYKKEHPDGEKTLDDFRERDYSGLTTLTGEEDVAAAEAAARQIVDDYESKYGSLCDDLWDAINKVTKATLTKSWQCSMMSNETHNKVRNMFKYYVPLRGFDADTAEDLYDYHMGDRGAFNGTLKTAKGRTSLADDPLAEIVSMGESAILQGNRNMVKRNLYNMAVNHPTDVCQLRDMWIVEDAQGEWEANFPQIPDGATDAEVSQILADHEQAMEELEQQGKAKRVRNNLDIGYRIDKRNIPDHAVVVYINGKQQVIYINGNPRAAQALNGRTGEDVESRNAIRRLVDFLLKDTKRFYSSMLTQFKPTFAVANFVRDLPHAIAMTYVNKGAWEMAKYLGHLVITAPFLIKNQLKIGGKSKYDRYFAEFVKNGGITGYAHLNDVEEWKHRNDRRWARLTALQKGYVAPAKAFGVFMDAIGWLSETLELIPRYNTYVTEREEGADIPTAIKAAKDITVNFNKKGSEMTQGVWGAVANTLRYEKMFFNPIMQGLNQFYEAGKNHPVRFAIATLHLPIFGTLAPYVNEMILEAVIGGGGGDDDDKKRLRELYDYWNLNPYTRRNNVCIFTGKGYVKIPIAPGFRELYGMGEVIATHHCGKCSDMEMVVDLVNQLRTIFSVEGQTAYQEWSVSRFLLPEHLAPFIDIEHNENFTGSPLWYENQYKEHEPEYKKAKRGTWSPLIEASKDINKWLGGTDNIAADGSGKWLNPAAWQHIISNYGGGIVELAGDIISVASDKEEGKESDSSQWPIAKRFYQKSTDERAQWSMRKKYQEYLGDYELASESLSESRKQMFPDGDYSKTKEFVEDNPEVLDTLSQTHPRAAKIYEAWQEAFDGDVDYQLKKLRREGEDEEYWEKLREAVEIADSVTAEKKK